MNEEKIARLCMETIDIPVPRVLEKGVFEGYGYLILTYFEGRGKGIATMLVKLLKNECFRRGAIPFYGTSLSNLGSWHVALGSGFYPAWVEIETIEE